MTVDIAIPMDIQPFGWELETISMLDALAVGFEPDAVALRSAVLSMMLEAG